MPRRILTHITNPSKKEAEKIARWLLEKRLIARANVFPIECLYWWEKRITEEKEWALIAKTLEKNYEKARKEIEKSTLIQSPALSKFQLKPIENTPIGLRMK